MLANPTEFLHSLNSFDFGNATTANFTYLTQIRTQTAFSVAYVMQKSASAAALLKTIEAIEETARIHRRNPDFKPQPQYVAPLVDGKKTKTIKRRKTKVTTVTTTDSPIINVSEEFKGDSQPDVEV